MNLELAGKSVLITGASRGIGEAIAEGFAREGCRLALVARSEAPLQTLAARLRETSKTTVSTYTVDLAVDGAAQRLAAVEPAVDILVNNAGAIPGGSLEEVPLATWMASWRLKVFGYIEMMQLYYPQMAARGGGVIINNIGSGGENYDCKYVAGCSGNASLMALTKAVGGQSLKDKIRVVGVNPGLVATSRIDSILRKRAEAMFGDKERQLELLAALPLGRAATVKEVADLIVFIASSRASYMSGNIITLDGGLTSAGSIV